MVYMFYFILQLIYNPEVSKIRNLLRIFENSQPEGKLYTPVINCLINLSANKEISDCLGGLRVFHIILSKLESLEESSYPGKLGNIFMVQYFCHILGIINPIFSF